MLAVARSWQLQLEDAQPAYFMWRFHTEIAFAQSLDKADSAVILLLLHATRYGAERTQFLFTATPKIRCMFSQVLHYYTDVP